MENLNSFIVLEGLDGSGTTTLTRLLGNRITDAERRCMETCEPTGSAIGVLIRKILKGEIESGPDALARLFTADRSDHLTAAGGIQDAAKEGTVVLCDRYLFSSLAYQSIGCPFETVLGLNKTFPIPALTLFIDVPPDVCAARRAERNGVEIFEHDHLQDQILENYHKAFDHYRNLGAEITVIDGTPDSETVCRNAWNKIKELPIFK